MTQICLDFGAPAPVAALEDVGVVVDAIEQRSDGGGVAEELARSSTGRLEVRMVEGRSQRHMPSSSAGADRDRAQKVFETLARLPRRQQDKIIEFVEAFIAQQERKAS